jgi:hypothetical protein
MKNTILVLVLVFSGCAAMANKPRGVVTDWVNDGNQKKFTVCCEKAMFCHQSNLEARAQETCPTAHSVGGYTKEGDITVAPATEAWTGRQVVKASAEKLQCVVFSCD